MTELDGTTGGEMARALGDLFARHGEELYLVGGAVRDELLGAAETDLDFATGARPERTAEIVQSAGIQPYRVGEKYGTIGVPWDGQVIEITTYRAEEVYPPHSRKPDVRFGSTLMDDLTRRDFTVNAMAKDPRTGEITDPLGGRHDLTVGLIRAVGRPADRFREDPLRILRAVRFAARLSFDIEAETWEAVRLEAPSLDSISRERIRDEYSRILEGPDAVRGLTLLRDGGLFEHTVPQILELTRMPDHGPRHPLSLWDHVMRVVAGVPPLLQLRWAALLHDLAKPRTRTHEANGRPRFFHHEEVGADMAREILTGLRYGNDLVQAVSTLVETHMQLHAYNSGWSDGAVRRLMLRLGPLMEEAILLAHADAAGHTLGGPGANAAKFDELEHRVRDEGRERVQSLRSPLSGDELMERYGRPGGPWVGRVKHDLLQRVIDGTLAVDDKEEAWRLADQILSGALSA